jgi:uncharacterized membrane protein
MCWNEGVEEGVPQTSAPSGIHPSETTTSVIGTTEKENMLYFLTHIPSIGVESLLKTEKSYFKY